MSNPENRDSERPGDPSDVTIPSTPGRGRDHLPERIGRYSIKRRIASGGMGTIFEGVQEDPRRPVAIKVGAPARLAQAGGSRCRRQFVRTIFAERDPSAVSSRRK